MNSGFRPMIEAPNFFKKQTLSNAIQTPFFFGGSQVPNDLKLSNFNGSGLLSTKEFILPRNTQIQRQRSTPEIKPYIIPSINK